MNTKILWRVCLVISVTLLLAACAGQRVLITYGAGHKAKPDYNS